MFTIDELAACRDTAWFREGATAFERSLLRARLGLSIAPTDASRQAPMSRFAQAVLGSLATWNARDPVARSLCQSAADIEAVLGVLGTDAEVKRSRHLLRAAVLYDLGGMPGTAASYAGRDGLRPSVRDFFTRRADSDWGQLHRERHEYGAQVDLGAASFDDLFFEAMGEVFERSSHALQSAEDDLKDRDAAIAMLASISDGFEVVLDRDLIDALQVALRLRQSSSALRILASASRLDDNTLRMIHAPAELWPVQEAAVKGGLVDPRVKSFGLAAPTGTGKTALTRVLLADFFQRYPDRKAFYLSPSRALTSQIAKSLQESLSGIGITVVGLGATLAFDHLSADAASDANVLVFTPEKADLLMRVLPSTVKDTGLVIVDEAHHIEQGTRGILLEFYLWRLAALLPADGRIVQLSAVAPNISELAEWLAPRTQSRTVKLDWRANRLRLGLFERTSDGGGAVQFENAAPYLLLERGECDSDRNTGLAQLAQRMSRSGIVLVLTTSTAQAEKIASLVAGSREESNAPEPLARLDARVERELYPESPLRDLVRKGVAFHHAQLPPRVRTALEELIAQRHIDVVCATTTLAEGVNFPFSTVIVDSLVGRGYQLSPRALWNIAGRAGRFGVDTEGHCILFRPSGWQTKLVGYSLNDYLTTKLDGIPHVTSALAAGLTELKGSIDAGEVNSNVLEHVDLADLKIQGKVTDKARRLRGLINTMRVGYAHAGISDVIALSEDTAPEFAEGRLLAARQVAPDVRAFASDMARTQRSVIRSVLRADEDLLGIAARVGWALETQRALVQWVNTLEDWQLEQFGKLAIAGRVIQPDRLGYLLGPLCKRMAELEGELLGGYTAYIAVGWIMGHPLTTIKADQKGDIDFGRLVRVIYARLQYLLPWALFGLHELLQHEAKSRNVRVGDGVAELAAFASEGVPSFDALRLVTDLDIERVDASRLASAYRVREGVDIFGWFKALSWETLAGIVRGTDRRRLDPDLRGIWERLRTS